MPYAVKSNGVVVDLRSTYISIKGNKEKRRDAKTTNMTTTIGDPTRRVARRKPSKSGSANDREYIRQLMSCPQELTTQS